MELPREALLAWERGHQFGIQVLPQGIQTSPIQLFWCLRCCIWHHTAFRGRCFSRFVGAPVYPLKDSQPVPAATLWQWITDCPWRGRDQLSGQGQGWTSQTGAGMDFPDRGRDGLPRHLTGRGPEHPGSLFTWQLCAQAQAAWQTQLQVWVSRRLC